MHEGVQTVDAAVEGLGRADSIVSDIGTGGVTGQLATRAEHAARRGAGAPRRRRRWRSRSWCWAPATWAWSSCAGPDAGRSSSSTSAGRPSCRDWPRHPGISFVAGVDAHDVPWAIGPDGRHDLATGTVHGRDPLADLGEHAPRMLRRALAMAEAPDLYVNSVVDAVTNDVAAFEGLVGSHGGLGGAQDHAVLLGPADLMAHAPDRIEGADELHRVLVSMLEACGHRVAAAPARSARGDG